MKLDTKDQSPDVMKTALQNLVSQNVAAVFMPFCSYTSVEFPIVADKKVPTFHVNTWHGNVDWVAEHNATNIFEGDPERALLRLGHRERHRVADRGQDVDAVSKTTYIVTSNDPYSLNIAKSFQAAIEKLGWNALGFDQFTVPQANWGGVLVKIRDANPGDRVLQRLCGRRRGGVHQAVRTRSRRSRSSTSSTRRRSRSTSQLAGSTRRTA